MKMPAHLPPAPDQELLTGLAIDPSHNENPEEPRNQNMSLRDGNLKTLMRLDYEIETKLGDETTMMRDEPAIMTDGTTMTPPRAPAWTDTESKNDNTKLFQEWCRQKANWKLKKNIGEDLYLRNVMAKCSPQRKTQMKARKS